MSSTSSETTQPLTTIFTYPSDCFTSPPTHWTSCEIGPVSSEDPKCYWSIPSTCFPSGGVTIKSALNVGLIASSTAATTTKGPVVVQNIAYSPGVLPSNFSGLSTSTDPSNTNAPTVIYGCLSGWNTYGFIYCTSDVTGTYNLVTPSPTPTTGNISAVMPQLQVSFEPTDLAFFTPASAPVLPTYAILSYERSVSRAAAETNTASNVQTATPSDIHSLSSGAQAGFGVGVAVAVLACIAIGLFLLRRRRQKRPTDEVAKEPSDSSYTKPELDNTTAGHQSNAPQELANANAYEADGQLLSTPEIDGRATQAHYSTKGRSELDGNFRASELEG